MTELQPTIRNARWRMFGHALRMTDDTPAKHAKLHYFRERKSNFSENNNANRHQQRFRYRIPVYNYIGALSECQGAYVGRVIIYPGVFKLN